MKIGISGSSGYIGSTLVNFLVESGIEYKRISRENCSENTDVDVIVHLAGFMNLSEGEKDCRLVLDGNVKSTMELLRGSTAPIVFASSDLVYGSDSCGKSEDSILRPDNNYALSKVMAERLLEVSGRPYAILRLFTVAGSDGKVLERLDSSRLFPAIYRAWKSKSSVKIFGTGYSTVDGSQSRDYVHVSDVVKAIMRSVEFVLSGKSGVFNAGTGIESTVLQVIKSFQRFWDAPFEICPERSGDIPRAFACNKKAKDVLGWSPTLGLDSAVNSFCNVIKKEGL